MAVQFTALSDCDKPVPLWKPETMPGPGGSGGEPNTDAANHLILWHLDKQLVWGMKLFWSDWFRCRHRGRQGFQGGIEDIPIEICQSVQPSRTDHLGLADKIPCEWTFLSNKTHFLMARVASSRSVSVGLMDDFSIRNPDPSVCVHLSCSVQWSRPPGPHCSQVSSNPTPGSVS